MTPHKELTRQIINSYFNDLPETAIDPHESMNEDELFQKLSEHVAWLIEHRMDYLLSLLYRLDVLERKINVVLAPDFPQPPHIAIAKLIIDRQAERIATRKKYRPENKAKPDQDAW